MGHGSKLLESYISKLQQPQMFVNIIKIQKNLLKQIEKVFNW